MYEFWYDYLKPNYGEKAKLCYMNTDSFIAFIKRNDIYKGIAKSNQINERRIWRKNHHKIASEDKKQKTQKSKLFNLKIKKAFRKNKIPTGSVKEFVKNAKLMLKKQQRFKSKNHVFTEEINKIALSLNDDKSIQSIDSIEIYVYRTGKDLVCKKRERTFNIIRK